MARLKRAAYPPASVVEVLYAPVAPALKRYIVGIDSGCREYYLVNAENEEAAEKKLRDFAGGLGDFANGATLQLDGCSESELHPDSVGDAFEVDDEPCTARNNRA
jgi:hypothetical protein